jgi:nicotinamidase-related amidase
VRPAIIIIDMVKDNFQEVRQLPITREARPLIQRINRLLKNGRGLGIREVHESTLVNYGKFALYPLLRIMTSQRFLREVEMTKGN